VLEVQQEQQALVVMEGLREQVEPQISAHCSKHLAVVQVLEVTKPLGQVVAVAAYWALEGMGVIPIALVVRPVAQLAQMLRISAVVLVVTMP